MSVLRALTVLPEAAVVLALPPMLMSVIAKTKAWFAGRVGPPWLQPYYDMLKLLRKGTVYSRTTTWVFRAGPIVNLAALLTAATMIPVLSGDVLLGFPGDVVLVAYLFALGRLFTVLAAMDTGSSFEGMGASREVTFGTMSEPALFLSFVVLAVATKSLELSEMVGPPLAIAWKSVGPAMLLVAGALTIVLLAETCRIPVDDPATHLELTMIHEVMVLDHSGPDFAFISYAAALKFMLLGSLLLHVALPHAAGWGAVGVLLRLLELGLLAVVVGAIESTMARLRLNRVPLFLAGASVLSGLATAIVLVRSHG
ncbi:MAG: NADH-quinone oxidoreductase subunit H [Planctomycetes bacterium]|nr:NADH-quinone oxidoreductase subunit H [Planctomycetota bacterium]